MAGRRTTAGLHGHPRMPRGSARMLGAALTVALAIPLSLAAPARGDVAADDAAVSSDTATPTPSVSDAPPPEDVPTAMPEASPSATPSATPSPQVTAPGRTGDAAPDDTLVTSATTPVLPDTTRITASPSLDVAVSAASFPSGSSTVVVAVPGQGGGPITAAAIAASAGAPVLYVTSTAIPDAVARELERLAPARIVAVGGTGGVGDVVVAGLESYARESVTVVAGADRYEISRAALKALPPRRHVVYVADGAGLVEAPLAVAAAGATGAGTLLVPKGAASADSAMLATLRAVGATAIVLTGSETLLSTAFADSLRGAGMTVSRVTGSDRYELAVAIAATYPDTTTRGIVVRDTGLQSAGLAAALAGASGQPLYLAKQRCLPDSAVAQLTSRADRVLLVGTMTELTSTVGPTAGCTAVKATRKTELLAAINAVRKKYSSSSFTVAVREVDGLGEAVNVGGTSKRETASTIKVFAAWAALTRVQKGSASLSTKLKSGLTLGTCLTLMIYMSDNYCHNDIVHWIGLSKLNSEIKAAGYANTAYGKVKAGAAVLYGGNRSTTNDLSLFLLRLKSGKLLNATYTKVLIDLMHRQLFRSRIPQGIPSSAYQASKPGSLWVAGGLLQNDTAIVTGPNGTFALAVLGRAGASKAGISAIARAVYTHFDGAFGSAAAYSNLHVRTVVAAPYRATPTGKILGSIPKGTGLEVVDSKRTRYQVRYKGSLRWISYARVASNYAY